MIHPRRYAQEQQCPACCDPHVHLSAVQTIQGNKDYPRGTTIETEMWCECGQIFSVFFSFHKGRTYYYEGGGPNVGPDGTDDLPEMWRD